MSQSLRVTLAGGFRVVAQIGSHELPTDQSPANGGDGYAPEPYDLFLSSIGTCAGAYVVAFCKQRELDYEGITITQRWERDENRRLSKVSLELELPAEFPDKYRSAVLRAMDMCSVKKALSDPPELESKLAGLRARHEPVTSRGLTRALLELPRVWALLRLPSAAAHLSQAQRLSHTRSLSMKRHQPRVRTHPLLRALRPDRHLSELRRGLRWLDGQRPRLPECQLQRHLGRQRRRRDLRARRQQRRDPAHRLRLRVLRLDSSGNATKNAFIYAADAAGAPGKTLASATIHWTATAGWHRATLAKPLLIQPNTKFFLGFENPGKLPYMSAGPDTVEHWHSGPSWRGPYKARWNYNLICCNQSGGAIPVLVQSGRALRSATRCRSTCRRPWQTRPAVLIFGFSTTNWGPFTLPINLTPAGAPNCALLVSWELATVHPTDGSGNASAKLSFPNDRRFLGMPGQPPVDGDRP